MAFSQDQQPASGRIEKHTNFPSRYVTPRHVEVWLPEGYQAAAGRRYAVLYMHDGQMLFDPRTTWNKQAWEVDDMVAKLLAEKQIRDVIVVGVWNGGETRHADYFPQKPFEKLPQKDREYITKKLQERGRTDQDFRPVSDRYLQFLVEELKPFIESRYAVKTGPKNTFVAGSSMGGLISMYALLEYPHIFGGAACLSTHWPGIFEVENNPIPGAFLQYLDEHLSNIKNRKIYFDYGDQTLDALYPPLQQQVDSLMRQRGFGERNWQTRFFPGKDHSEAAWRERLDIPLRFLLGR